MKKRIMCLLLCLGLVLSLAACKGESKTQASTTGDRAVHTVRIVNQSDAPLANVGVYIYEDSTKAELVWYDTTNEAGEMTFEDVQKDTYVAVLAEVPVGYGVEEYYPLTGLTTEIRLSAGTMTGEEDITYKLGDMVMDFTVTDTDGNTYSLLELLQSKDAVVLNFYYNGCVPCQMEFPHLQEAYLEYSENIAVIAMNPMDDEAAVAQFKQENGLTFPMVACNPNWEKIMNVTAYPTTVVIDRLGNIVLKHTGSVDSAQTFKDVFAAVSGEDYEQIFYQSLSEVPTTAQEGSKENPVLMGPTSKFELTIEGGKEHYIEFLRLNNLTLRVADPDAYVIYNGKTHTPKNGVVSLLVDCPDMNTPMLIGFGNSSDETKTFTVTMSSQPGSMDNPYTLVEGDNQVKISAGNDQGVYYIWTAKENGSLKAWCTSATAGVEYDCILYNLTSYAQRSLNGDGQSGEMGRQYVEVLVNKGDRVQMIAAVLPDESWNYPAGNFTYMVEFVPGPGRDKDKVEKTTYTVTVTDDKEQPLANVNFHTVANDKATTFATNAEGVATVELPTGEYKVTMIIPEGYTSEITEFTLTKDAPEYSLVLTQKVIVMVDYTVIVTDTNGESVEGATVIIGDKFAVTDADGKALFNLEQGEYTASIMPPEGQDFAAPQEGFTFPEGESILTAELAYVSGTVKNPIDLTEDLLYQDDFQATVNVPAGTTNYYCAYRVNGMLMSIDGGESVTCATADVLTPYVWTITNDGAAQQSYTITLSYPLGHYMNPQILENLGQLETNLTEGDEDGYYYSWTAQEEGFVAFYLASVTDGVEADIALTNTTNSVKNTLTEDGQGGLVTLNVTAGDVVSIQIMTDISKATQIVSVGSFTAQENTEDAKITYSVTVKDDQGNAMSGIAVTIGNSTLTTDEGGMAFVQLVEGSYNAVVTVPEGYKADATQFSLSVDAPQANVVLTKLQEIDYKVDVQLDGAAYTGSMQVQILQGTTVAYEETTTSGSVTAKLLEGNYTVKLTLDDATLAYDAAAAVLAASAPELTLTLEKLTTYTDYSVTVTDMNGKVQSGILVQILKGTQVVATGTTDTNGKVAKNLETGEYNVRLTFSGTSYYYNQSTAVLTGVAPNLTIRLASEVDPNSVEAHWYINDNNMYVLGEGSYHIQVSQSKPYFTTSGGYNDCLFMFMPTQTGTFRISIDQPGVGLRNYGSSPHYLYVADHASNYEDNALPFEVKQQNQVGNVFIYLGVEAVEGITDLCITITRVGEPGFDISAQPWSTDWMTDYKPVAQTVTVPSGQKINYVDIKAATDAYTIVYNETDGFYHVGSVDGPVLYLNLGTVTTKNISFNIIINGDGLGGGSAVKRYFYDENGAFVKKEEYTDRLLEYIACADAKYGLYPVTQDLAYILQNAKPSWWDSTSPDYLLTDCNPDLGWLFACCYIQ